MTDTERARSRPLDGEGEEGRERRFSPPSSHFTANIFLLYKQRQMITLQATAAWFLSRRAASEFSICRRLAFIEEAAPRAYFIAAADINPPARYAHNERLCKTRPSLNLTSHYERCV